MTGARGVELKVFAPASTRPETELPATYAAPEAVPPLPRALPESLPPSSPPPPFPRAPRSPPHTHTRAFSLPPSLRAPSSAPSTIHPLTFSTASSDISTISLQLASALAPSPPSPPPALETVFRTLLDSPEIDVDELRRLIWAHGVPDASWARPTAWKLLLGLLPPQRADWDAALALRRASYWSSVASSSIDPSSAPTSDHPLSDAPSSAWAQHFRDAALRTSIDKDVVRTMPDIHRFAPLRDALRRLLFVYAKSTPDGYRQGMNELAAILLLAFADAPFADAGDAEADAAVCFSAVMEDMATVYAVKESASTGVGRQLREMRALLRIKDPRLDAHLAGLGIDPRFYALRWMRLWLAREFVVPDVIRFWDSFLAAEIRLPWVRYVCVAMLVRQRDELLSSDFTACMKLLLHYPSVDVADLLRVADRLRTANVTIVRAEQR